jgi:hypothetical protein
MVNKELLIKIRDNPHLLGLYLGYKDLTKIHSDWIIKLFTRKEYVLLAHRNSYKTSCIVIGVIWLLLFDPESTILLVRKDFDNANSILEEIRKHYNSEKLKALYEMLFNIELDLKTDKRERIDLSLKLNITKESNIECIGIGGSITGKHFKKIICDDIVSLRDRVSTAEREKTIMFYYELQNIKTAGGSIVLTGTKWHSNDLFSKLDQSIIERYDCFATGILTQEYIEKLRSSMTASLFAANYLMKDMVDSNYFNNPRYGDFSYNDVIGVVDPAYSGNNTTAVTFISFSSLTIKGFVWRKHIEDCEDQIIEIANNLNCGSLYIENNADKGSCYKSMSIKYPSCYSYYEKENKHNKITTYIKRYWDQLIFDNEIQIEYISQINDYEEGKGLDDAPDTLATALRIIESKYKSNSDMHIEDISSNFRF